MRDWVAALARCVQAQAEVLDDFIDTLQTEHELLLTTPSDESLGLLTQHKNDFARRLGELDGERAEALRQLGFDDTREHIEAACQAHPALGVPFEVLWHRAAQAQALNEQNGAILRAFMAHNQSALETLRGLLGLDLYDARGRRTPPSGAHPRRRN